VRRTAFGAKAGLWVCRERMSILLGTVIMVISSERKYLLKVAGCLLIYFHGSFDGI
jgi:hypothetical protein